MKILIFHRLRFFFISWPFMLFGQRISSVVVFYLAIIFSAIPFFYFLLSIQFPIPCLHYLTHFIWNWISNTAAAAATTFFFHLYFRLSFTLWIEFSQQNEHTKNTVETMGITYRMEKNIAAKAKISIFLSLEGSKFILQIATNTTNSATPVHFGSVAKWPKKHLNMYLRNVYITFEFGERRWCNHCQKCHFRENMKLKTHYFGLRLHLVM